MAILSSVADSSDSVVDICPTGGAGDDTTLIVHEGGCSRLNGYSDGTLVESCFQLRWVVCRYVLVVSHVDLASFQVSSALVLVAMTRKVRIASLAVE